MVAAAPKHEPPRPAPAAIPRPPPRSPILRALIAISSPLAAKPKQFRDILGWHALWIGFLAVCVWGYILLIRPNQPVPVIVAPAKESAKSETEHGEGGHDAKKDAKTAHPQAKKKTARKTTHASAEGEHH